MGLSLGLEDLARSYLSTVSAQFLLPFVYLFGLAGGDEGREGRELKSP